MSISNLSSLLRKRRTWALALLAIAALLALSWWWRSHATTSRIVDLGQRHQIDSAWTRFQSSKDNLTDCQRQRLTAYLASADRRSDTLLLKIADSLKMCFMAPDSLQAWVSLGHLRIAEHSPHADSSTRWTLLATSFRAASECIKLDSNHASCFNLGFDALFEMGDGFAQLAWIKKALVRWPNDTSLLARRQKALAHQTSP